MGTHEGYSIYMSQQATTPLDVYSEMEDRTIDRQAMSEACGDGHTHLILLTVIHAQCLEAMIQVPWKNFPCALLLEIHPGVAHGDKMHPIPHETNMES